MYDSIDGNEKFVDMSYSDENVKLGMDDGRLLRNDLSVSPTVDNTGIFSTSSVRFLGPKKLVTALGTRLRLGTFRVNLEGSFKD
jgi:hypothetical protein